MRATYDPQCVAAFYDEFGHMEFSRPPTLAEAVSRRVHIEFVHRFIRRGYRVLEVGAGTGLITLELARAGAQIVVTDISRNQLDLNAESLERAGLGRAVEARELVDAHDLSRFQDKSFDAVVCFRGPLDYLLDHAEAGLAEQFRVTVERGCVLLSVKSLLGWMSAYLASLLQMASARSVQVLHDLRQDHTLQGFGGPPARLFTAAEFLTMVERRGAEIIAAAADTCFSARQQEQSLPADVRQALANWEVEACREPGALDMGTHIVVAARRL